MTANTTAHRSTSVSFVAHGEPVPWRAPVVTRRGAFKERHVRAWQTLVATYAKVAMEGREPLEGPVAVSLVFVRPAAKSKPKEVWWAARPDLSNLVKAVEDAMNGIVYHDDNQVVRTTSEKIRGDHPCVIVQVMTL